ncbi:MAG: DUF167 domain-containing protein [Thiobacillus sp.]
MAHFEPPVWLRRAEPTGGGWLLDLHVQPGARITETAGEHGGRLKLKIAAPPVDNKANVQILSWLSKQLGLPRSAVTLVRGESARLKTVLLTGMDDDQLRMQLEPLLNNKSKI